MDIASWDPLGEDNREEDKIAKSSALRGSISRSSFNFVTGFGFQSAWERSMYKWYEWGKFSLNVVLKHKFWEF